MARCDHGFEPKAVRCPSGCHDSTPAAARGREKTYSDGELRAALIASKSIREVAERLGVGQTSVYLRSRSKRELWQLYERAKATSGNLGNQHPGFKDLTGQTFGVLKVVERAENQANGNAAWLCRCEACGDEHIYQGIQLRSNSRSPRWCRGCRSANPGTVTRRSA